VIAENLGGFLAQLERAGELARVARSVSVVKEISEIADRCMKAPGGGPALLFETPALAGGGSATMPVAINLFGSDRRICLALGVNRLDDIGTRITELLTLKPPEGWREKLAMLPRLAELTKYPPRVVSGDPPCQQVVVMLIVF
jgi:4-hydroxy-3-polyprenylbenzoate decarboxylase